MCRIRSQVCEQLLRFVRDQEDADAGSREVGHDVVDALLVLDVDSDRRAVEDQHAGRRGEPLGQDDPLLVAARERLHRTIEARDLDGETLDPFGRERAAAPRCDEAEAPAQPVHHGEDDVVLDRLLQDDAEPEPVLGHIGDAGVERGPVGGQAQRPAVEADGAAVGLRHAEQAERELGPPGAQEAGEPQHLAAVQGEADVGVVALAGEPGDLQKRRRAGEVARDDAPARSRGRSSDGRCGAGRPRRPARCRPCGRRASRSRVRRSRRFRRAGATRTRPRSRRP